MSTATETTPTKLPRRLLRDERLDISDSDGLYAADLLEQDGARQADCDVVDFRRAPRFGLPAPWMGRV